MARLSVSTSAKSSVRSKSASAQGNDKMELDDAQEKQSTQARKRRRSTKTSTNGHDMLNAIKSKTTSKPGKKEKNVSESEEPSIEVTPEMIGQHIADTVYAEYSKYGRGKSAGLPDCDDPWNWYEKRLFVSQEELDEEKEEVDELMGRVPTLRDCLKVDVKETKK